MAVERTTVRRCRKARPCDGYPPCRRTIMPGELYYEHITGPGHDILGNEDWRRQAECSPCAEWRTGKPVTRLAEVPGG